MADYFKITMIVEIITHTQPWKGGLTELSNALEFCDCVASGELTDTTVMTYEQAQVEAARLGVRLDMLPLTWEEDI